MKYVAARVAATAAMASIASLLLTAASVYADEKPGNPGHHYGEISNPGHHYGQLKHTLVGPPPTQAPPPTTTTQPQAPPPATHPAGTGHTGAADPTAGTNPDSADLPATVPNSALQPVQVIAKTAPVSNDWVSWLILLILPALLVVWVIVFARATLTAVRRWSATPTA